MNRKICALVSLCSLLALQGCFDNEQNKAPNKDHAKPSLQMQQPDNDKK